MATDETLDQIEENFDNPAAAEVDGVIARQHSLRDQIEFHKYKKAQDNNPLENGLSTGFRISRFTPPGALGD